MARKFTALVLLMLTAAALAGCSKCDIAGWGLGPKACHSDPPMR